MEEKMFLLGKWHVVAMIIVAAAFVMGALFFGFQHPLLLVALAAAGGFVGWAAFIFGVLWIILSLLSADDIGFDDFY